MSAYAHQMERQISFLSQTTPSARTSELGSHYEPGFAISAFTATILVGAFVVAGVSLLALLTALAIMLQSCQSKSTGIIDMSTEYKSPDDNNTCRKILALHAELNELSADEILLKCKDDATHYITSSQYARDLEFAVGLAVGYFSSFKPQADGLDVILMDADDFLPSVRRGNNIIQSHFTVEADILKHILMLGLFKTLQVKGWKLVLVSRKLVEERNATMDYLVSSGYTDWLSLIMRLNVELEMEMESSAYMFRQRAKVEEDGKRVVGIVSSNMDALNVSFSGMRMFKLPSHV